MREGDYKNHDDLEHVGYGNMPSFANTNAGEIWRLSDKHEGANRTVYRELELGFPLETKKQDRIDMVEKLMSEKFKGHAYTYAIHNKEGNPHAHVMFCDRKQDGIERTAEQFFMRANKKNPEKGGCAKAEELNGKDRGDHVEKIRKSWADRHNAFYKSIGSEERADHRTLVAQRDEALALAKEFSDENLKESAELAASFRRKAIELDRPPAKRLTRKEWQALKRSGEIELIREERTAVIDLAKANADLAELSHNKLHCEAELIPQDIVGQPEPPKSAPIPRPEAKTEKIQEVIQTPDATRCEDPDQLLDKPITTISSVPVNPSPVSPIKPVPVVVTVSPSTQSVALPPETKTNPPIQQPAFDFPLLAGAELAAFAAFVQRMKDVAIEKLALLCQIASDFGKLSAQNEKGILSDEIYNQKTDQQEKQVAKIAPTAQFDYDTYQIKIAGQPVPEIAASQFKQPEQQKPAPIQGLKTGGIK
ncbi:MAG: MobA/MobL family protein [Betaproteobacteria bacterium]|nr:MobA/MobL family protein [Betaproteobacteria bacterium]